MAVSPKWEVMKMKRFASVIDSTISKALKHMGLDIDKIIEEEDWMHE